MSRAEHDLAKGTAAADPAQTLSSLLAQAIAWHQQGRLAQAKSAYEAILQHDPHHFDALHLLGVLALQAGQAQAAVDLMARALQRQPDAPVALANLASALLRLEQPVEALLHLDKAVALAPDHAQAWSSRGNALRLLGRLPEALESLDRACRLRPDYAEAFINRGVVFKAMGRVADAVHSTQQALQLRPDHAQAHNNLGNYLRALGQPQSAIAAYETAIRLQPDFVDAIVHLGIAHKELRQYEQAMACYDRALQMRPGHAPTLFNQGNVFTEMRQLSSALACFDQAIAQDPDYAEAWGNRGNVLSELKRLDEAVDSYREALRRDPDLPFVAGALLHTQGRICDWSGMQQTLQQVRSALQQDRQVANPFAMLGVSDSPQELQKVARLWASRFAASPPQWPQPAQRRPGPIRVAYISADWHNHATTYLMAQMLECHDRSRFEVHALSFGPPHEDEMRQRVRAAVHRFTDVRAMSDAQVAQHCRALDVDIAIDLKGYTQDARTGILAQRCAPLQLSYLGYPGTMGAPFIDYLVADPVLITPESRSAYDECLILMPDSYQVNDALRPLPQQGPGRREAGLPEEGFVFCSFNNNYKILPEVFDIWMRLLQAVPGSVLWLLQDNAGAARNLRSQAQLRGVAPERLVFAERVTLAEHLARHRLADLFLDTWPCNAHTTASDALWTGLPVLTCAGQTFASRVAASLLHALGLPELVQSDPQAYEQQALCLARDRARLQAWRAQLCEQRAHSPLFDAPRFTRHFERALQTIHDRRLAGLPPQDLRL